MLRHVLLVLNNTFFDDTQFFFFVFGKYAFISSALGHLSNCLRVFFSDAVIHIQMTLKKPNKITRLFAPQNSLCKRKCEIRK